MFLVDFTAPTIKRLKCTAASRATWPFGGTWTRVSDNGHLQSCFSRTCLCALSRLQNLSPPRPACLLCNHSDACLSDGLAICNWTLPALDRHSEPVPLLHLSNPLCGEVIPSSPLQNPLVITWQPSHSSSPAHTSLSSSSFFTQSGHGVSFCA